MVIGFVLFFLAGLAFGYAAGGIYKLAAFLFPIVLALSALSSEGVNGEAVVRLVVALVLTGVGILLGRLLEERSRGQAAGAH